MFHQLHSLIPKAAAHFEFTDQMKAIQVCQEYRRIAKGLFPKLEPEEMQPKHYKHQILTILVPHPTIANQLQMQKHKIHEELNAKFGPNTLKNIKIEVGQKPIDISTQTPGQDATKAEFD